MTIRKIVTAPSLTACSAPMGSYRSLLRHPGMAALLATQFAGALNDNLLRMGVSLFVLARIPDPGLASGFLALTGAMFVLPYLTLTGLAGRLSDVFDRRTVIVVMKVLEIVVMIGALLAFAAGSLFGLFAALLAMAAQSALFSPARYGILPDLLPQSQLSRANGLGEMAMQLAIVIGTGMGGLLYAACSADLAVYGMALLAVALAGLGSSLLVPKLPRVARLLTPRGFVPFAETRRGLAELVRNPAVGIAILGTSAFWMLGAALQLEMMVFGKRVLLADEAEIGLLQATLGLGVAVGCVLAGWLSGDRVRLGLVPAGAACAALGVFLLAHMPVRLDTTLACLVIAGMGAGLFVVPLFSHLHVRSSPNRRGLVFATNNLMNMVGVLVAVAAFYLLDGALAFGPRQCLTVLAGAAAIAALLAVLVLRRTRDTQSFPPTQED